MRADMARVIVERPRLRPLYERVKGLRRRKPRGVEDLPRQEGIKRMHNGGSKVLNEHLGPLRRYLESQVGRPWNKVFSEICRHINRHSAVQDHVRDHIRDFVETDAILVDGVPQPTPAHGRRFRREDGGSTIYQPLYVCPVTGLLRRVKRTKRGA